MKKVIPVILGVFVVMAGVAAVSAFEAHVINVTAHIENALSVSTEHVSFGTVFPQEYVTKDFTVSLSDSFLSANRVDDVTYTIKQKPKCKANEPNNPEQYAPVNYATEQCPEGYTEMLTLCPFLSKTDGDPGDLNDTSHGSYFVAESGGVPAHCVTPGADATGKLAKSAQDVTDNWIIDLKVPPVAGTVGQDWPAGCPTVPEDSKDYGCDLWIEVTGISLPGTSPTPTPNICSDQADVMLVLDRSASINPTALSTLKTAAKAFVVALNPDGGVHMGQSSFSTIGTLDLLLTGNQPAINTAIDGLVSGGWTNLYDGLHLAQGAFSLPESRPTAPNIMVVITDGVANRPLPDTTAPAVAATEAAADKAAGTEIYVVGVGNGIDETYLKTQIATDANHYFRAADYNQLQVILEAIAACKH